MATTHLLGFIIPYDSVGWTEADCHVTNDTIWT